MNMESVLDSWCGPASVHVSLHIVVLFHCVSYSQCTVVFIDCVSYRTVVLQVLIL